MNVTLPVGRPSKYDPKYCQQIVEFMAQGYSFESFSGEIGVAKDTLNEWCDQYPDFSAAKKEAVHKSQKMWETLLLLHARGDKKVKGGSAAAVIFALKCRFGYQEKDMQLPDIKVQLSYSLDDEPESK